MAVTVFEFDDFKLDCDRFELCRAGRSLKLERIPMELLILLARRNGHLVSRAEIAEHLWDKEVFVDTEHGINTAIRKIRQVLRDDPEQSRFVQTVTGKGYRFIAPIIEVRESLTEENQLSSAAHNRRIGDATAASASPGAFPIQEPIANRDELPNEREEQPSRRPRLRYWLAATAVLALLVVVIGLGARGVRDRSLDRVAKPKISSLAVLPLDNLSGDPGQDYFADGMTDELTTMLAKNSTLRIVSRTSVMQYKGAHRPLPEIARALGVDGILEGSVERSGDKVHMTIQLIQAPSDTHVWAESYDRNANDVVSLPREAAQTIAKRLNSAVLQSATQRYVSPEAHDAYLRGRYIWFTGSNDDAGKYFRKATELQPDYALGWTGLAGYYGAGAIGGDLNPEDAIPQTEAAANKAIELDDSLPEAHQMLSAAMFLKGDWARADQEIARAIELNPSFAEAYHLRSKMDTALGRNEEAIESEKKAMELDPFQRPFAMGLAYFSVRQYDAAINDARQRLETQPEDAGLHWILCESYRRKGELKEAAQEWEKLMLLMGDKGEGISAATIRRAFEKGGYKAALLENASYLKRRSATQYVSPVDLALQYAQLGRREETLSYLEEGLRQHSPLLLWIQNDPAYDFLHGDERYRSIIKRIGLPPAY
jgi:TolB-like protein/DNA-binding winged helix-turn-helix (wHTH) protein/cytochrome c-type biogenesis protein CcmH/NrfG